jgi:nucleotide-binding universal stress UspA family protein
MNLPTILVHLELGSSNEGLLQVSLDCAKVLQAGVIGVAACHLMPIVYSEGYVPGDLINQDRSEIEKEMSKAEAGFHAAMGQSVVSPQWRSAIGYMSLSDYVAQQARTADLIVTGPSAPWSLFDSTRVVDVGDLVMRAGRPVLIVPTGVKHLRFDTVVVAWKECRESRRAIADALPILKKAGRVVVVQVAAEEGIAEGRQSVADVVEWLSRHDIGAQALVVPSIGNDAKQLDVIASERGADLVVAGAYGHNRLREYVLGGVTRVLLVRPTRCAFVSN